MFMNIELEPRSKHLQNLTCRHKQHKLLLFNIIMHQVYWHGDMVCNDAQSHFRCALMHVVKAGFSSLMYNYCKLHLTFSVSSFQQGD